LITGPPPAKFRRGGRPTIAKHRPSKQVLAKRPSNAAARLQSGSEIALLSSKDIIQALGPEKCIVMACNTRLHEVVPGIMRAAEELDAPVAFELAKSEHGLDGGYTGHTPESFFKTVVGFAEELHFSRPFFIHGDHVTVKDESEKEVEGSRKLIDAEIKAGYTSFCIDPSFNPVPTNVKIMKYLAPPVLELGIGLEVELGEIKHASGSEEGRITTVAEATEYMAGLDKEGIRPTLLAINNGSKHGNYKPGEEVHIDLARTAEVFAAVSKWGVYLAQHGITGTPPHLIGQFADHGIRKGNVGTLWQNVTHANLPPELFAKMQKWASDNGKDIKFTTKPFRPDLDRMPGKYREQIAQAAYREAKEMFEQFRAVGKGSVVLKAMGG
jgi:fructose-bisphosphate aldolase class II